MQLDRQNAGLRLQNQEALNQELQQRVKELEQLNSMSREVFVAKEVEREMRVVSRVGDRADALLDRAEKYTGEGTKQLLFTLLFYHGKYTTERKRNLQRNFQMSQWKA